MKLTIKKQIKNIKNPDNNVFYSISMFPYPSGNIHMGHFRNFCAQDFFNRYKMMSGKKVLSFLGWDAFGLPAENAAIQNKISAKEWTYNNIEKMNKIIDSFGNYYDHTNRVITCDPSYYLHQQTLFLKLYDAGLIYRKKSIVNWDPIDKTVLANEQVNAEGKAWRSGAQAEKKELKQWFFKTTHYAEELLQGLQDLDWPTRIINAQKQWIGKSIGYEIKFNIKNSNDSITVFTTKPETINGVKFLCVAENTPYAQLIKKNTNLSVMNPFNNQEIPVYIADYVLDEYGTGAVMGVPQDDERDRNFALQNNVQFEPYEKNNSIKDSLQPTTNYKLRDWCFSRQRKWGCPIPMIHCDNCGVIKSNKTFLIEDELQVQCPQCNQLAQRETDTMDTFVDSSWYSLRYLCANNQEKPFDKTTRPVDLYIGGPEHATGHLIYSRAIIKALKDLKLIDFDEPFLKLINQGMVLAPYYKDKNNIPVFLSSVIERNGKFFNFETNEEVFLCGIAKMSKSLKNIVEPTEIFSLHGVEACRFFIASQPLEVDMNWNIDELNGCERFLNKIIKFCNLINENKKKQPDDYHSLDYNLFVKIHKILREANDKIQEFKTNTFISQIRILFNLLEEQWKKNEKSYTFIWGLGQFLILLWPICMQIAYDCYHLLFNDDITKQKNYNFNDDFLNPISRISIYVNNKHKAYINSTNDRDKNTQNALQILGNIKYKKVLYPNEKIIKFIT